MADSSPKEKVENKAKICRHKIVYVQNDVFVHSSTSVASNYAAKIIGGQISIVEKDDSSFVNWVPLSTEAVFDDYDISHDTEWSIVSHSKKGLPGCSENSQDIKNNANDEEGQTKTKSKAQEFVEKHTLSFETKNLHSIRRSDSRYHWHFLVFILKDGTTLPALHFHSGGTKEFIQHLNRYIWLTKSANNPKVFVVCNEHDQALQKSLDHLQLFSSDGAYYFSRVLGSAYVEGLGAFSKVTKYVRDAWAPTPGAQHKPDKPAEEPQMIEENFDNQQSLGNDFENLLPDVLPELGEAPEVVLGKPVTMIEWMRFTGPEGKIQNVEDLKKQIHQGGIDDGLRKEIWKFLLNYDQYDQTYTERIQTRKEKWNEYVTMKQQWQSISPQQEKNFALLRERKHLVDKDVIRTDRKHSFYKEEPSNTNTQKLYDILMTYCMYNFDLGYVQGMSDLLSPILYVVKDEVDAFWCFVGFMEMVADNFEMKQAAIHKQLDNLKTLLQYIYPRLYHHLEKNDSGNLYFCFRWLLILFKREFEFPEVMRLWESLWTQDISPNFHLFLCLAILKMEKDYIIENQCGFNEILKHINGLSMNINLEKMLIEAETLCLQLREIRNLPDDVTEILTGKPVEKREKCQFPGKPVLIKRSEDEADKGSPSGQEDVCSDDEIEVVGEENIADTDCRSKADTTETTEAEEGKKEKLADAVDISQTAQEELVELSTDDKAVF